MADILAADYYVNNARLFEAVAKLWIKPTDLVLDPTYGKGGFYKRYRPNLIAIDLYVDGPETLRCDFRKMPFADGTFEVVVFDPAYVTPGGRETSTIDTMNEAYGMDTAAANLPAQWKVIVDGMAECCRVLAPGGLMMQKCMNYISSAAYHNYVFDVTAEMRKLGLRQVDQFMVVRKSGGPQPKERTRKCAHCKGVGTFAGPGFNAAKCLHCDGTGRIATVQQHSRNNYSVLIVARKGKG